MPRLLPLMTFRSVAVVPPIVLLDAPELTTMPQCICREPTPLPELFRPIQLPAMTLPVAPDPANRIPEAAFPKLLITKPRTSAPLAVIVSPLEESPRFEPATSIRGLPA